MPSTYVAPTGEKLGAWLYRQVRKHKDGGLPVDQAKRLVEAGLV
ncbi:helicase associated domain-containing protein (plasmid) [Pseudomonas aeruginosa]